MFMWIIQIAYLNGVHYKKKESNMEGDMKFIKKGFIQRANKSLKYPVTMVEDLTPKEEEKLLDAVLFYTPEEQDVFGDIESFWNKITRFFRRNR
jgi:hypothetical protein